MQLRVRRMGDSWYAVGMNDLCDATITVDDDTARFYLDTASDYFTVSNQIETMVMEERSA